MGKRLSTHHEWLAKLEVGSPVAVWDRGSEGLTVGTVESVSADRIRVDGEEFDRETGYSAGPAWTARSLLTPSAAQDRKARQDHEAEESKKRLRAALALAADALDRGLLSPDEADSLADVISDALDDVVP